MQPTGELIHPSIQRVQKIAHHPCEPGLLLGCLAAMRKPPRKFSPFQDIVDRPVHVMRGRALRRLTLRRRLLCLQNRTAQYDNGKYDLRRDRIQLRLQVFARGKRFSIEAAQNIDGLDQGIDNRVGQRRRDCQKRGVEQQDLAAGKRCLHSQECLEQLWYEQQQNPNIDENHDGEHAYQTEHHPVLGLP